MTKPVPKFTIGQVVWCNTWRRYARVTAKWLEAIGHLKLRWRYNIYEDDSQWLKDVGEKEIRRLTKKEQGN